MTTMANNPYNGEKYIFENVLMPLQNTRDGVLQTVASFNQAVFDYGGQIKSAVSNSVTQAGLGNALAAIGTGMQSSNNAMVRVVGNALQHTGSTISGTADLYPDASAQELASAGLSTFVVGPTLVALGAVFVGAVLGTGLSVGAGEIGAGLLLGALGPELAGILLVAAAAWLAVEASGAIADYAADLLFGDGGPLHDYNFNIPIMSLFSADPLVLDLNGDGVSLFGSNSGSAYFDFGGDGFREKTGWMSSGDGVLVRDLNGNGLIENLSELLGSPTQDTFTVLRGHDLNNDNAINQSDAIWSSLKVWQDANGNGITDAGELKTLASLGITRIGLNSSAVDQVVDGNLIHSQATFTINGVDQQSQAVFFGTQPNNAVFVPPTGYVTHPDVFRLPTLKGGGAVAPLQYSMTVDTALRTEMKSLMLATPNMTYAQLRSAVETLVEHWTNTGSVASGSRGAYANAKHIAILEAFSGSATNTTPNQNQANILEVQFQKLLDDLTVRIATQSYKSYALVNLDSVGTTPLLNHNFEYLKHFALDSATNRISIDVEFFASEIIADIKASGADPIAYLAAGQLSQPMLQSMLVASTLIEQPPKIFVEEIRIDINNLGAGATARDLTAAYVIEFLMAGGQLSEIAFGTTTSNTIQMGIAHVVAVGDDGDDVINGTSLDGIFLGGTGNDTLNGDNGNDTYIYNNGDGADTITELANKGKADRLQIAGHTLAELKVSRSATNANDLVLTFTNNADKITIVGAAATSVAGTGIESFVLSGGVTKTIAELYQITINQQQTAAADTIRGFNYTADLIAGGLGNDAMNGEDGSDTYIYNNGDGADTITETANNGSADKLQIAGHTLAEFKVARSTTNANDLVLTFTNNADKFTLAGAADASVAQTSVETFVLSGGVTKTLAEIYQIAVNQQQTTGADTIRGFRFATDTITGGLGNDAMNGDDGNDTYIYNSGDGADTITETANNGSADKLQIAGHTLAELKVARSTTNANDLVLTFTNNADKITLAGTAAAANVLGSGVENFVLSGGVTKTLAEIYQIAVNQQQTTGADTIRGYNFSADTITGGLGNDALNGEDGSDTYIYNNGDGADTITETANNGSADKLQIAGHTLAELKVARSTTNANDLVLTFTNNADKITLVGAAATTVATTGVESFVLSGGVTKTLAEIYQIAVNQQQTTGADTIMGFALANDVIAGGAGNDTMSGKGGNDTFIFAPGFGKDTITDFSAGTAVGDVMRLSLGTSFDTYAEVMAAALQVGSNTVISITANDTITLTGITKTTLAANDFEFL